MLENVDKRQQHNSSEPIVESNDVEGTIHAISMKSILTSDYLKSLK